MTRYRATRRSYKRRGSWLLTITIALFAVATLIGVVVYNYSFDPDALTEVPLYSTVADEEFRLDVLDEGTVESASNVEIKCGVKVPGGGGTEIIDVVPEGTIIKPEEIENVVASLSPEAREEYLRSPLTDEELKAKVGEHVNGRLLIARLDSSGLEQNRDQQKIVVNTSKAIWEQAKNNKTAAEIALTEYLEGIFKQEEKTILGEINNSQQNLRRANDIADSSKRLADRGYITELQLQGDLAAVDKAQNEFDLATLRLNVLQQYTKEKQRKTLQSDIDTALAKELAEEESYALEVKKLNDINSQIRACLVFSPKAGQVVYANIFSGRGGAEFVVEPGARVREGQTIVRIPDPTQMQVKASVNESQIRLVKRGMKATLKFDALPGQEYDGEVISVNQYAEPSSWNRGNVKEYATTIRVLNPPAALRPGLTAAVEINVERRESAIQFPVQCLIEHQGRHFCLIKSEDKFETRQIKIGTSNDKTVTIESDNVKAGEQAVMNPRRYDKILKLPELPPLEKPKRGPPPAASETPAVVPPAGKTGKNAGKGPPGGKPGGAPKGGKPAENPA